jgi:hypothetical protein
MSTVSNSVSLRASLGWQLSKAVTGFDSPTQSGGLSGTFRPATATFNHIYHLATTSIAAAGTQALNFYDVTSILGESVTSTKLCGVLIIAEATVTGGELKIEPHGTNGLTWPFSGTTPAITLTVGTTGAGFLIWQGTTQTVGNTTKQWLLTNSGSQTITVTVAAVIGT